MEGTAPFPRTKAGPCHAQTQTLHSRRPWRWRGRVWGALTRPRDSWRGVRRLRDRDLASAALQQGDRSAGSPRSQKRDTGRLTPHTDRRVGAARPARVPAEAKNSGARARAKRCAGTATLYRQHQGGPGAAESARGEPAESAAPKKSGCGTAVRPLLNDGRSRRRHKTRTAAYGGTRLMTREGGRSGPPHAVRSWGACNAERRHGSSADTAAPQGRLRAKTHARVAG